jgi:hypothetical protein
MHSAYLAKFEINEEQIQERQILNKLFLENLPDHNYTNGTLNVRKFSISKLNFNC